MRRREFLSLAGAAAAASLYPSQSAKGEQTTGSKLRILYFTDVHAMLEREAPELMRETAKRIRDEPFDLVIGGGDFVHGGFNAVPGEMEPRFEALRVFLDQIGHRIEPMIGNHDYVGVKPVDDSAPSDDPRRMFREFFELEKTWRTFDKGDYRFLMLDPVKPVDLPERYHGHVDEEQMEWMRAVLKSTPADQPLVLCTHIPLRTTFKQIQESPTAALPPNLIVTNANEVLDLFKEHRLVLVLQGHLHFEEWIRWNRLNFLMGGALCGAWWQGPNLGTHRGFGVLELDGSSVEWNYLTAG